MTTYISNAPIILSHGLYQIDPLSHPQAQRLLQSKFVSAVGQYSTAKLLSYALGQEIDVSCTQMTLQKGDTAIIFRLPENSILDEEEPFVSLFDLSLLTRLE